MPRWLRRDFNQTILEITRLPGRTCEEGAVLAADDRGQVRLALENRFLRDMRQEGQEALPTHNLLALPDIKTNKEAAAASFRAAGADTILVVRLLNQTTYTRTVAATPQVFVPLVTGYEDVGWYDYYSVAYMDMGVVWTSTTQDIYLHTSLFDLKTGKRLWSAQTKTVLKDDTDRLAQADLLAAKLVTALRKDGLVR